MTRRTGRRRPSRKLLFVPFGGVAVALSVASVAFACGSLLGTFKVTGNANATSATSTGLDTLDPADPTITIAGTNYDATCSGTASSASPYGSSTTPPCSGTASFFLSLSSSVATAKSLLTGPVGTVTIETGKANISGIVSSAAGITYPTGFNDSYLPNSAAPSVACGYLATNWPGLVPVIGGQPTGLGNTIPASGTLCPDDQHGVGTYDVNFTPVASWMNHTSTGWALGDLPPAGEPFGKPKCMNADRENAVFHLGTVTIGDSSFTAANEGKITAAGPPRLPNLPFGPVSYSSNTATFALPPTVATPAGTEATLCVTDVHGQFGNLVPLTIA